MSVAVAPGSTWMTGIPHWASSIRAASDNDASAALLAEIGAKNGTATLALGAPMLTMRPLPSRSSGRNACITRTGPNTLTSNWRYSSASGRSSIGPCTITPALLTTACRPRPPCWLAISFAAAATLSELVTSSGIGMARARSAGSCDRKPAYTVTPRSSSVRVSADPMPPLAPVTSTARDSLGMRFLLVIVRTRVLRSERVLKDMYG
jgi:hypothetical protein